jgi:hypothetical protein
MVKLVSPCCRICLRPNGDDVNFVTSSLEFGWNFAPTWVLRGGAGINVDTERTSANSTYVSSVAIGCYLTTNDSLIFKELVAHVAVSTMSDVLERKDRITDVYVAPGLQFGLDANHNWYVLGAIHIPVSGPHPYDFQLNFCLARNY